LDGIGFGCLFRLTTISPGRCSSDGINSWPNIERFVGIEQATVSRAPQHPGRLSSDITENTENTENVAAAAAQFAARSV